MKKRITGLLAAVAALDAAVNIEPDFRLEAAAAAVLLELGLCKTSIGRCASTVIAARFALAGQSSKWTSDEPGNEELDFQFMDEMGLAAETVLLDLGLCDAAAARDTAALIVCRYVDLEKESSK